eukprot:6214711-Pleurochrysis_carterae.AAC.4
MVVSSSLQSELVRSSLRSRAQPIEHSSLRLARVHMSAYAVVNVLCRTRAGSFENMAAPRTCGAELSVLPTTPTSRPPSVRRSVPRPANA